MFLLSVICARYRYIAPSCVPPSALLRTGPVGEKTAARHTVSGMPPSMFLMQGRQDAKAQRTTDQRQGADCLPPPASPIPRCSQRVRDRWRSARYAASGTPSGRSSPAGIFPLVSWRLCVKSLLPHCHVLHPRATPFSDLSPFSSSVIQPPPE
jgi:hypothetical protein